MVQPGPFGSVLLVLTFTASACSALTTQLLHWPFTLLKPLTELKPFASLKLALSTSASVKSAPVKSAPVKSAPVKLTFGPTIYPLVILYPVGRFTGLPIMPPDFTPVKVAPDKSALVKLALIKVE